MDEICNNGQIEEELKEMDDSSAVEPEGFEEKLNEAVPEEVELTGEAFWQAEAKKFEDLYLRTAADRENMVRRVNKEKQDHLLFAAQGVIRDLLPVLDNLNLALNYADLNVPAVKNLAEGVRMTLKGFLDILVDHGLKEISASPGDTFDPNYHEALGQEINNDLPDKSVSKEVAKGYSLHQRVLRPVKVMVVKNENGEKESGQDS
jgi:molecular chaperone GrpE